MKALFFVSIFVYAIAMAVQFAATAFKKDKLAKATWLVFLAAFAAHTVFLVVRGVVAGRLPLSNQFEFAAAFSSLSDSALKPIGSPLWRCPCFC